MMLINTIQKTLIIQSNQILHNCTVQIFNSSGIIINKFTINNQHTSTFQLSVSDGKYLVRLRSNEGNKDKHIYIKERK